MGWGSFTHAVTSTVDDAVSSVAGEVKREGGSLGDAATTVYTQTVNNAEKAGKQTWNGSTTAAVTPFKFWGEATVKGLNYVAPAIGRATELIRANPELAKVAGSFLGIPAVFGSGDGQGSSGTTLVTAGTPQDAKTSSGWQNASPWLIAGGAVLAGALFIYFLRKK